MSSTENILSYLIFVAWLSFFIWYMRRAKLKAAQLNKAQEFERAKMRGGAVIYPAIGALLIGMMLFNWQSVPQGNEPVVFLITGLGVISILFGLYKLYRLRRFR